MAAVLLLTGCTVEANPPEAVPEPTAPPASKLEGIPVDYSGFRLVMATSPPSMLDPATGATTPLPGVPGGDRVNDVIRVGKFPVVLSAGRCGPSCLEPSEVLVYGDPKNQPWRLGKARSVAPAADESGVWLIRDDGDDLCRLQYVSLLGVERGRGRPASCTMAVRQEVPQGLLITVNTGTATAEDVLIDPATGRAVHQFPRVLAITKERMLLAELTEFSVLDLRNNQRTPVKLPVANGKPGPVVPSRDGYKVAVLFGDPAWAGTATQTADVWVLALDTLTWTHAPSTPIATELKRAAVEWTEDDSLVLATDVVASWRLDRPQWTVVKTPLPAERNQRVVTIGQG
ncbi:hypothetical protein [Amycolatopsis keratiniphila]|uniref:Uncharacterized protein n=1 Tax=Amycolatopsis keratiniphila subsp. keratiniphila TaxID=227715 RepID=A0A1W2LJZ2_9PSEU|nr:hypothetical protein [Amycolatopsis keratiniphila]ONF62934.1 hypothetical protein AVR91_0236430 [Amycolatopsis keratiniphila subsp. keratiniphila]